jgi:hypothetical protein
MAKVYVTSFPDGSIVRWKPLTWDEYRGLVREHGDPLGLDGAAAWSFHHDAAVLCVLDQLQDDDEVSFEELYAGTINTVGTQIVQHTGFTGTVNEVKSSLGAARARLRSSFYESAKAYVRVAFRLSEQEIGAMDRDTLMDHLSMVEIATGQEVAIEDPSDQSKQRAEPTKYVQGPDGRPIPVLTKNDLTARREIDTGLDNRGIADVDGFDSRLRGMKKIYGD